MATHCNIPDAQASDSFESLYVVVADGSPRGGGPEDCAEVPSRCIPATKAVEINLLILRNCKSFGSSKKIRIIIFSCIE